MQGRHAKTDTSSNSGLLLLCWIARGTSSFWWGVGFKKYIWFLPSPPYSFSKEHFMGVCLFAGRKANRGSEKYKKIIFVKECF
jgi:hypothetical protein